MGRVHQIVVMWGIANFDTCLGSSECNAVVPKKLFAISSDGYFSIVSTNRNLIFHVNHQPAINPLVLSSLIFLKTPER